MQIAVHSIDNKQVGNIDLLDAVFAVKPRRDILTRVNNWQLAKRRAGTHAVKGESDVSGTGKKPWAQKGTGRARHGSLRSPQFRKGGVIFGPVVRSHEHDLPKKIRKLGLIMALSAKQLEGKLIVLNDATLASHKTKLLAQKLDGFGLRSVLVIDGANLDPNFFRAIRNLPNIDILPEQGANVHDILRHDALVLTVKAVEQLQARLSE